MSWAKHKLGWALAGGVLVSAIAFVTVALGAFDDDTTKGQDAGAVASEGDGVGEGIQVHGDWVIEVRNTDGSVAERREFENALQSGTGTLFLANSLARVATPGVWGVFVTGGPAAQPCGNAAAGCLMREPISSNLDQWPATHFPTLTVSSTGQDPSSPPQVVLQGNFAAPQDGSINIVRTINCWSQPPNVDPSACNNSQVITETNISTPVNVVAGQQVLVTVRISFS
jgi:hypothetical protein